MCVESARVGVRSIEHRSVEPAPRSLVEHIVPTLPSVPLRALRGESVQSVQEFVENLIGVTREAQPAMWKHTQTIILVTIVAALVWMFAEAETLREHRAVVTLSLLTPDGPGLAVETEAGLREVQVEVVLEGSAARLERVQRVLREALAITPGMEGVPTAPGTYDVDVLRLLRAHPVLVGDGGSGGLGGGGGVGVKRVEPGAIRVRVDEVVEVILPVIVRGDTDFTAPPVVTPASVRLLAPRHEAMLVESSTSSAALVILGAPELTRLTPGRQETLPGLAVRLPPEIASSTHARLDPPRVDVTLTVRNRTTQITVPRVPVTLRIAPDDLAQWDISIPPREQFLTDLTLTGPQDVLARIESGAIPVGAVVSLSREELTRAAAGSGLVVKEAAFPDIPVSVRTEAVQRIVRVQVAARK